ncbi:MAG: HNH endonuclease [Alphaproteobacteria bacterium]|nr:HNH endonuclease [Alphaproteobacteria bacterium]MDA8004194.1 HNH endonuclease [Alphaproteobacteria bacterium]MDA8006079.1 HNH endonuclease [Alphaproteobacteria bacterium]MDA8013462.1 HNH endonuclease [Alphaproteobacteria bacterium]
MNLSKPVLRKPFPSFKWRWMEVTPQESFNRPDILLGITRAMEEFDGCSPSDAGFLARLETVQDDLLSGERVNLVSGDPSRNVIRRQGRYWRGMGLLAAGGGKIEVTDKGRKFAEGVMSNDDFVVDMVLNHQLPNLFIEKPDIISEWESHAVSLKPLKIIIGLLDQLYRGDDSQAYLTAFELFSLVIPLSIDFSSSGIEGIAAGLKQFRNDPAWADHLPDCVEGENDKRMAMEHLLFLKNYGLLDLCQDSPKTNRFLGKRFYINVAGLMVAEILSATEALTPVATMDAPARSSIGTMSNVDLGSVRARRIIEATSRPNQARFRKLILDNFGAACALTGESTPDVLDACHIISVSDGGKDSLDNGICLRADIHKLFDNGKLRISEEGDVTLSGDVKDSPSYRNLPEKITIPANVNADYLRRRNLYGKTAI